MSEPDPAASSLAVSESQRKFPSNAHEPFRAAGMLFHDLGYTVFPAKGKKPLVKWGNFRKGQSADTVRKLMVRHPGANIAVATGKDLTVVDVDDPKLKEYAIQRFGKTPCMVETPSGGLHLGYHSSGERNAQRIIDPSTGEQLKIDIRGEGGMVIWPPSFRPEDGRSYRLVAGELQRACTLPPIVAGALPWQKTLKQDSPADRAAVHSTSATSDEVMRNVALYDWIGPVIAAVGSCDAAIEKARAFNARFDRPLADREVMKTVRSRWQQKEEGRLMLAGERWVPTLGEHFLELSTNPHALALFQYLRYQHANVRSEFLIVQEPVAESLNWADSRTVRRAITFLLGRGFLHRIYRGGQGPGDPSKYTWGPCLGGKSVP